MRSSLRSIVMVAFLLSSSVLLSLLVSPRPLELSISSTDVAGLPSLLAANHSLVWTPRLAPVQLRRLSYVKPVSSASTSTQSIQSPLWLYLSALRSTHQQTSLPDASSCPRPLELSFSSHPLVWTPRLAPVQLRRLSYVQPVSSASTSTQSIQSPPLSGASFCPRPLELSFPSNVTLLI